MKAKGIVIMTLGLLIGLGGAFSLGWGVIKASDTLDPIVTMEAPGSETIEIVLPGQMTLWHEHHSTFNGRTVTNPAKLPGAYSFELVLPDQSVQFVESSTSATQEFGDMQRRSIGSFNAPEAGTYVLRINGSEKRIFTMTRGGNMAGLKELFAGLALGVLLGLVGLALIVWGFFTIRRGRSPQTTTHKASPR